MSDKPSIDEITWDEIRDTVKSVNPRLALIIDQINPNKKYTFIKIRYPYGISIVENGEFKVPNVEGEMSVLNHYKVPQNIRNKLDYSSVPIGLILHNSIEVCVETIEKRIVPYKIFNPGVTFGMWEALEPKKIIAINQIWNWNIFSGARSVFMLPKISDSTSHERLRRTYKLSTYVPNRLEEHWKTFVQIAKNDPACDWYSEILFFSKEWLKKRENSAWVKLYNYWLEESFNQYSNWRNKISFELAWEGFTLELERRKLKPKPYQLDIMRHLISIGLGVIPGFKPTGNCELALPVKTIQDAYMNVYLLKHYAPIIMQPYHIFPHDQVHSVYYSLQIPTLPECLPDFGYTSSTMKELRMIEQLVSVFMQVVNIKPKLNVDSKYDFVEVIKYEYFHNEKDQYGIAIPTHKMPEYDSLFKKYPNTYGDKKFAENSHFLRGCVKISIEIAEPLKI